MAEYGDEDGGMGEGEDMDAQSHGYEDEEADPEEKGDNGSDYGSNSQDSDSEGIEDSEDASSMDSGATDQS